MTRPSPLLNNVLTQRSQSFLTQDFPPFPLSPRGEGVRGEGEFAKLTRITQHTVKARFYAKATPFTSVYPEKRLLQHQRATIVLFANSFEVLYSPLTPSPSEVVQLLSFDFHVT